MFKRNFGFAVLIALWVMIFLTAAQIINFNTGNELEAEEEAGGSVALAVLVPEKPAGPAPVVYGIPTDTLEIVESVVERGENLSQLLNPYNISPTQIDQIARISKKVFDVRRINTNQNYTILHSRDSAQTARYFIYEPSEIEYVIYDLRGDMDVEKVARDVQVLEKTIAGEIKSSLYLSMLEAGGSPQLVNQFADIYAWRLNLSHLQPGDKFKLIYDEKVVNGTTIGFGKIKSAYFEHSGKPIYAINFSEGSSAGYYDQDGKSLKKAFLREPLEFSRISSRFTMNRFHPVQKRYKPHLGTDFAAPRGTPIRTVGDGVVLEAAFTKGNGYYVKIKHDKTYTTQYLHMSKFAKNIRKGATVQQGQTIGYVGSTGLATGPHLCYRFWQNGKQVDALGVKLPLANPIEKKYMAAFQDVKEETLQKMEAVNYNGAKPNELLASGKKGDETGA